MNERDDATLADDRSAPSSTGPGSGRAPAPELGERYDIGPVLGRGGMGEIRLARDTRIDREVAVKLLRSTARDEATVARFFREARVQGVLDHPAVVPVHDLGVDPNGNPYFVMKRLAGITLHDVLATTDPAVRAHWPRRQLLVRLVDVCLAIEFAHTRGVVHRDVKPANIMLGEFGEAYVLDWGLARITDERHSFREILPLSGDGDEGHTKAGDLLGTPGYMSPEQVRGEAVDPRTDTFALGCVLFEILAGTPALPRGLDAIQVTLECREHRPSRLGIEVPPELDDLCARATAADPATRPSARALGDGIQAYLDGDRDLGQRRALAEAHTDKALLALTRKGDEARAIAMREAGSALVLDPANLGAQGILRGLLLDVPETIPAEARTSADDERGEVRRRSFRKIMWTYIGTMPVLAFLLVLPIRHVWPIIYGIVMGGVAAVTAWGLARKPMPMSSPWFIVFTLVNCALIATIGLLLGPLLIMPFFLIGSLSAILSQPTSHPPAIIVGLHLLPIVVLFGLEGIGVLPPSFHIDAHTLVVTPWAVDMTGTTMAIIFCLGIAVQVVSTIDVQLGFQRAQQEAQDRIHAQSWHLRQLLPGAGELTAPTPKVDPPS